MILRDGLAPRNKEMFYACKNPMFVVSFEEIAKSKAVSSGQINEFLRGISS